MDKRPVNLNLLNISFPITAIASILHRISGVILFLFIPMFLWILQNSLQGPGEFVAVQLMLTSPLVKFVVWGVLSALFYHVYAGVRHLLMDCNYGETYEGGRLGAKIVIALSVITALLLFVYFFL